MALHARKKEADRLFLAMVQVFIALPVIVCGNEGVVKVRGGESMVRREQIVRKVLVFQCGELLRGRIYHVVGRCRGSGMLRVYQYSA